MSENVIDVIVAVLLLGGALMSLAAAIGLMRFPDLMSRMHAASKPQVLGLLLFLMAMAVEFRSWVLLPILAVCWIFQLLTAPVSAHMVGRAGYRTKHLRPELLTIDELDDVVERAQRLMFEAAAEDEGDSADPKVDDDPGQEPDGTYYTGNLDDEEMERARRETEGPSRPPGRSREG
ncbi:monovalent cation/H(+) antiporter subunit G [Arthrobacter sp. Sa2BUA2]|uniref:Monovalent cation/H(+) antiporter subunit G n=1 Tax=Arthrobacter pullicola TaxID=2762224 RepID=A0ABR8YK62_9MICC|nr:monovalent cation/H(+) antiporter subunit G [Arthrobacter pullicola]